MARSKTVSGARRKLDALRLVVARETFCNRINRDIELVDIPPNSALHELSGQYSLSICLNWLATKYGFPVCKLGINPGCHAEFERLGANEEMRNRYPFAQAADIGISEAAWRAGFGLLENNFEPALELIGQAYIHLLCDQSRGEFYTPPDVVRLCVDLAYDGVPKLVWDPSCGTGNFLLGVIRRVRQDLHGERLLEWVCESVYGSDIDPRAVEIARHSVFVELSYELSKHPEWLPKLRISVDANLDVRDSLLFGFAKGQPDLIITNPPYVSFGSRNQPAMPDSQSKLLRGMYPAASEYKIRMHSLFQEMAINTLGDGGAACLLVPDAFLTGAFYKKLRELIHHRSAIEALIELPESIFPEAVAGKWCVTKYRKAAAPAKATVLRAYDKAWGVTEIQIPQDLLVDCSDKFRFQVVFTNDDAQLLARCRKLTRLADYAAGHTGIRARAGQRSITADSKLSEKHQRALISGASIGQHSITWDNKWLNIDRTLLFGGGFDANVIQNPKILMRQTGDRIIAAVDTDGLYHLNNIHSFTLRSDQFDSSWIYFLCGLMNSALWLRVYQLRSREGKRALAQIDIEMIESMPMPEVDETSIRRIAELARAGNQAAIDVIVDELYGLPVHAKVN